MTISATAMRFGCIARWSHAWQEREQEQALTPDERKQQARQEHDRIMEAQRHIAIGVEEDRFVNRKKSPERH